MAFVRRNERFDSEPKSPKTKLPFVRLILLTLKTLTVCPLAYDGTFFHPQKKIFWSVLYTAFFTAWIIVITVALVFFSTAEGLGHEHKGLFMIVAEASLVFNIITNILTVVVTLRDRYLLYKCMSTLQRLWQLNGSVSKLCKLRILFGEILFLLNPLQNGVSLYLEQRFPLGLLIRLSKVTPEMWYYQPVRICCAIVGYWPGICFSATGYSVLLWMSFFYGCGSECLDGLSLELREILSHPAKVRHKMVARVRESVGLFDDFFAEVENLLSSRIFWFLIVFALNVIKGFGVLLDNSLHSQRSIEKIFETLIASLLVLFGLRNISLCARKVKCMTKTLDLDPVSVSENKLEDLSVRLNHIRVQPSAMGFYTVDLRLWPGMVVNILTLSAIIAQFATPCKS